MCEHAMMYIRRIAADKFFSYYQFWSSFSQSFQEENVGCKQTNTEIRKKAWDLSNNYYPIPLIFENSCIFHCFKSISKKQSEDR